MSPSFGGCPWRVVALEEGARVEAANGDFIALVSARSGLSHQMALKIAEDMVRLAGMVGTKTKSRLAGGQLVAGSKRRQRVRQSLPFPGLMN